MSLQGMERIPNKGTAKRFDIPKDFELWNRKTTAIVFCTIHANSYTTLHKGA